MHKKTLIQTLTATCRVIFILTSCFISISTTLYYAYCYTQLPKWQEAEKEATINLAVEYLKQFEGFKAMPYECEAGVKTVGYGDTEILRQNPNLKNVNQQQAEYLLRQKVEVLYDKIVLSSPDLSHFYLYSDIKSKTHTKSTYKDILNVNQQASLISLAYNIGQQRLINSSLKQLIDRTVFQSAGDKKMFQKYITRLHTKRVEAEFLKWSKVKNNKTLQISKGLIKRRNIELALFTSEINLSSRTYQSGKSHLFE